MPVAKKAIALCALGALSTAAIAPVVAQTTLNGAGATFPAPIYQKWFSDLAAKKEIKPLPEFGSTEDFPLQQALNQLQGKPVIVAQAATETKAEAKVDAKTN